MRVVVLEGDDVVVDAAFVPLRRDAVLQRLFFFGLPLELVVHGAPPLDLAVAYFTPLPRDALLKPRKRKENVTMRSQASTKSELLGVR